MRTRKILFVTVCILMAVTVGIWVTGRYGWKLFGFRFCTGSGIESVTVTENAITVYGFYPGSFPEGYLGYIAMQADDRVYLGVRYDPIFGIMELGQFTEVISLSQPAGAVYLKTADEESLIWSKESELTQGTENPVEKTVMVTVEPVVETLLGQGLACKFFSNAQGSPYAQKVLLSVSEPVRDFKIFEIQGDFDTRGDYCCTAADLRYEELKLLDSDRVVIETEFEEYIPRLGFCFTEPNEQTRYFYLCQSGKDGLPLAIEMNYYE